MTSRLRPDGFLERGSEVTRMEAFVDAAFAFALTMLVISVGSIPDTMPKLIEALKGTPAFAASFALVASFWYAHMTWSRRYGLDDGPSIALSLVLVFLVMVFVYPLKAVFASLFAWVTHGWLPYSFLILTLHDLRMMFTVYGIMFGSMGTIVALLYAQAWRRRADLGLSLGEQVATAETIVRALLKPLVAGCSILVAMALPDGAPNWALGLPGMTYALMGLSGPVPAAVGRRVRRRLVDSAQSSVAPIGDGLPPAADA